MKYIKVNSMYKATERQNLNASIIFTAHIAIMLLIVSIPESLLNKLVIIDSFNLYMQSMVPSLNNFRIYSRFSTGSVLAYSFAIILMPLFIVLLRQTFAKKTHPAEIERIKTRLVETFLFRPVFYLLVVVTPFLIFPGNPYPVDTIHSKLEFAAYSSRIGFAFVCSIMIMASSFGVILILNHLTLIYKVLIKNSKL